MSVRNRKILIIPAFSFFPGDEMHSCIDNIHVVIVGILLVPFEKVLLAIKIKPFRLSSFATMISKDLLVTLLIKRILGRWRNFVFDTICFIGHAPESHISP